MEEATASYADMVKRWIESCLIFHMSKEECMEALSKHANIDPVNTSIVWNGLQKENKKFFESYAREMKSRASLAEMTQKMQKLLSDLPSGSASDDKLELSSTIAM